VTSLESRVLSPFHDRGSSASPASEGRGRRLIVTHSPALPGYNCLGFQRVTLKARGDKICPKFCLVLAEYFYDLALLPGRPGKSARGNIFTQQSTRFLTLHQLFTLPDHAKVILALFYGGSATNSSSTDIHNMKHQAKKRILQRRYLYLKELLEMIVTHPSQFIEHDQLAAFNITVTDSSLHSDLACDAVPGFFKPFPHDLMEESFKHSSQLEDDISWPSYDPESPACFTEAYNMEWTLGEYHRYVTAEWEESPSGQSVWRARW
jgi:hypothetical protein